MRRREFYEQAQPLFKRGNAKLWESYEETLFAMRRPVTHGNFWRIRQFVGGNPPLAALNDMRVHRELDGILSRAKYSDAAPLGRLEDIAESSTEFASALMHFNNPAYPIFDEASVRGLNHLGIELNFRPRVGEGTVEAYQAYIDSIQELKDGIPFNHVPEKNYYLTRIIQEALWELGVEAPVPPAPKKAPSRRA